jgi:rhamnosyltransferase
VPKEIAQLEPSSPQPKEVCAVVVTYNPEEFLFKNLKHLNPQAATVVLVDNGSDARSTGLFRRIEEELGIQIFRNQKNLGIAAALNTGIRYAIARGYRWVATFDQDSTVTSDFFKAMLLAYDAYPCKNQVALIAPVLCVSTEEVDRLRLSASGSKVSLTRTAMTSGSLMKTSIFASAGLYDEAMFIDYVDYDFCLRLGKRGLKLIRAHDAFLLHRLGASESHSLMGIKLSIKTHSPWRRYYIMRNRVVVYKRYAFSAPLWCLHDFIWIFIELTKILLFETAKGAKIRNMVKGLADGLAGRVSEPQQAVG